MKFGEIISAVRSRTPEQDSLFVQLMHILLKAKTERADEEDGDEGRSSSSNFEHSIFRNISA